MAHAALDEDLLAEIVRGIVSAVRPEKVILFGSWARGDAAPDSDLDLFLQVEPGCAVSEVSQQAYAAIRPFRAELGRGVDILVKDRSFVERYGELVGTVVGAILQEGKVLYAR